MLLIDYLVAQGFTVIEDEFPLKVSLNQLSFPVAILSPVFTTVTETVLLARVSLQVLYPQQTIHNYHKAVNLGQAIQSLFAHDDVIVSPVYRENPLCSGGELVFTIKDSSTNCGYGNS